MSGMFGETGSLRGGPEFGQTSTRSDRGVPLTEEEVAALEAKRAQQAPDAETADVFDTQADEADPPGFISSDGTARGPGTKEAAINGLLNDMFIK